MCDNGRVSADDPAAPCPTPWKRYRTWSLPLITLLADALTAKGGPRYEPYQCVCGDWHIRDRTKYNRNHKARRQARDRATRALKRNITIAEHDEWLW